MLVLSRREGELIYIGIPQGDGSYQMVEIKVVSIRAANVSVGITAPQEYVIHRQEVWEEIEQEGGLARRV
ncbi:MAG: carbon storage regulator [Nanoarchaeota archaeon]|nr:carbon storage regulator [Nanoarchaeota archaeon]MBU4086145.1 carbon storage regulator [Nanoarchaeota archaeon]